MDIKKILLDYAIIIDKEIKDILNKELKISGKISPIIHEVIENSTVVTLGGKRLRGALVYYSYIMLGGKHVNDILLPASAIEILHSYLLAIDDVMDSSDMRHRKPTLNKVYENKAKQINKKLRNPMLFGNSIAMSTGFVLSHIAIKLLTEINFNNDLKIKVLNKVNREFTDTGYGQIIDCFGSILKEVDEEFVMKVHYYKTGKYTYETPLHIGALLAEGDQTDLNTLSKYAINAGIAFQLQDDILGMYGDEYRIGKPADSDLKEGKKTLLIIKALEKANKYQKEILDHSLGNINLTLSDLELVRNIIIDTGSLEYSKLKAMQLVSKAKNSLIKHRRSKWNNEGFDFLIGIADYMIDRDL